MKNNNQNILYELNMYDKYNNPNRLYYNQDSIYLTTCPPKIITIIFDNIESLQKWFLYNGGEPIPSIRKIEYIGQYKGINDVIKITKLSNNNEIVYCTAINKDIWIYYNEEMSQKIKQDLWTIGTPSIIGAIPILGTHYEKLDKIYEKFSQKGLIKNNVYQNSNDRTNQFSNEPILLSKPIKKLTKKPIIHNYNTTKKKDYDFFL